MHYTVFVKQVPDTSQISVDENGNLLRAGVPSVLDPYSEHALELALRIKSEGDKISVVTMGPDQAESALRRCLEIGADEAYLLSDRAFARADVYATARTLTAFMKSYVPDSDLLFFGKQSMDGSTGQTPAEVAEMLGVEQFYYVTSVGKDENGFTAVQDYGDEIRTCRVPKGSVLSVSEGDINRRLSSISRYLEMSQKEITVLDRIALGLGNYSVGTKGSPTSIVKTETVRASRSGTVIDGSDPAKAAEHIRRLF